MTLPVDADRSLKGNEWENNRSEQFAVYFLTARSDCVTTQNGVDSNEIITTTTAIITYSLRVSRAWNESTAAIDVAVHLVSPSFVETSAAETWVGLCTCSPIGSLHACVCVMHCQNSVHRWLSICVVNILASLWLYRVGPVVAVLDSWPRHAGLQSWSRNAFCMSFLSCINLCVYSMLNFEPCYIKVWLT